MLDMYLYISLFLGKQWLFLVSLWVWRNARIVFSLSKNSQMFKVLRKKMDMQQMSLPLLEGAGLYDVGLRFAQWAYKVKAEMPWKSSYTLIRATDWPSCMQAKDITQRSLYLWILTIYEDTLQTDDPKMLGLIGSLANVYHNQGRYAEAESLSKRNLDTSERSW